MVPGRPRPEGGGEAVRDHHPHAASCAGNGAGAAAGRVQAREIGSVQGGDEEACDRQAGGHRHHGWALLCGPRLHVALSTGAAHLGFGAGQRRVGGCKTQQLSESWGDDDVADEGGAVYVPGARWRGEPGGGRPGARSGPQAAAGDSLWGGGVVDGGRSACLHALAHTPCT